MHFFKHFAIRYSTNFLKTQMIKKGNATSDLFENFLNKEIRQLKKTYNQYLIKPIFTGFAYQQEMNCFICILIWLYVLTSEVPSQGIITKESQKRSKNSVSAKVVAIVAIVTLIKDCYKI